MQKQKVVALQKHKTDNSRRTRQQKQIELTQVSRKQIGEEIQKAEAENRSEKSEI